MERTGVVRLVEWSYENGERGLPTFTLVMEFSRESEAAAAVRTLEHLNARLTSGRYSRAMIEVAVRAAKLEDAARYVVDRIEKFDQRSEPTC
jgi:hypothetical protein